MNVLYKGNIAEIWEIGRDTYKPDWVQEAIKLNYIVWLDNHVRIFLKGLNPSKKVLIGLKSTLNPTGYVLGFEGEVLYRTNCRVISKKKFLKEYDIID